MNATPHALRGYSNSLSSVQTSRSSEFDAFGKVTRLLQQSLLSMEHSSKARNSQTRVSVKLAEAVHFNRKLWNILATDAANDSNKLPISTRASILSLCAFTNTHSQKVLRGDGDVRPLIEINAAIMRGLSSKGSHQ